MTNTPSHTPTFHAMNSRIDIRTETNDDIGAIAEVTVAAFQTLAISNHTEQFIIEALRAAKALMVSLVAESGGRVTLFLRVPGAPLSNNLCERALKKAILHRKNALFYRTLNGATVGDRFMSLIHTAELHQVEPFDYLVALLRHAGAVALDPAAWMPWNYTAALARRAAEATGPAPE